MQHDKAAILVKAHHLSRACQAYLRMEMQSQWGAWDSAPKQKKHPELGDCIPPRLAWSPVYLSPDIYLHISWDFSAKSSDAARPPVRCPAWNR